MKRLSDKDTREEKAFVGIWAQPLIKEAHAEIDERTRGRFRSRKMLECRRGLLWMVVRVLKGGRREKA